MGWLVTVLMRPSRITADVMRATGNRRVKAGCREQQI
jgi:hypothetical protein